MARNTKQPKWEDVYKLWKQGNVPEVQIIDFDLDIHSTTQPWFNLRDDKQIVSSNPMNKTADHMSKQLVSNSEEFRAVFMISAFLIEVGALDFLINVLNPVWTIYGERWVRWWHPNVKYILPAVDTSYLSTLFSDGNRIRYKPTWQELIEAAVMVWTAIGLELAVVRIPELMNSDSKEYGHYLKIQVSNHEEAERKEYERLKLKFKGQS